MFAPAAYCGLLARIGPLADYLRTVRTAHRHPYSSIGPGIGTASETPIAPAPDRVKVQDGHCHYCHRRPVTAMYLARL
jgi:hypothetical protein